MLLLGLLTLPGCVRVLALGAKVFAGDPSVRSPFALQTGMDLQSGDQKVALVVDVPHAVSDDFASLATDLQEELILRMRRHNLALADTDAVTEALESGGRDFSATRIAKALDVDCILHIHVEKFSDALSGGSDLLQSHASGIVTAYKVDGEFGDPKRHAIEVFQQPFQSTYPTGHPFPAEQVPRRKFVQNSIRKTADAIGRQFYDVETRELF
jgi:hypothetical protein